MRAILLLWTLPLVFFWTWFALSANDVSFGTIFFSRQLHDLMMQIYGNVLGVSPDHVPSILAWACIVDTAIILAIAALRWRHRWLPQVRALIARKGWLPTRSGQVRPVEKVDPALPAE
jgi:hypothetical protein